MAKGVGWGNLPRRVLQALRVRSGYLARRLAASKFSPSAYLAEGGAPESEQLRVWARRAGRFLSVPPPEALARIADQAQWQRRVEDPARKALAGEHPYFGGWTAQLGWPPTYNHDPVQNIDWPTLRHWLDTAYSSPPRGDIKLVWEPSRFSLAYYFARGLARSGDEEWAESFWRMFDAWVAQNPPQCTVAWACGQEITFRLMAMLTGAMTTLGRPAATPQRLLALSRLAWQSGRHIRLNINQARMQGNNHAVSEAVGLWTIALLFDEFRHAGAWRDLARKVLAAEVERQIYDDGSYVQHSLNYHRVMMDDLLWACRLGELSRQPLPRVVHDGLERATAWLLEMIDEHTGQVPNYGANDGAQVLSLSCCDFRDYRPAAQAAYYLLHRKRCFQSGPWDEKMLWLFGPESLDAPAAPHPRKPGFAAASGGYYVLRGPNSWAMTRCHTYRHRPSQADMLHLDLWYKGTNLLRDAGSYLYTCPHPWQHHFASTAAHNTVEIDKRDQMIKGPRFLWFRWTQSRLLRFETSPSGRIGFFEGEHYGYTRLAGRVVHRRSICRIDDTYVVIDGIFGTGPHEVALRWHLCQAAWQRERNVWSAVLDGGEIALAVFGQEEMNRELVCGREDPAPEGWQSQYYGRKHPCPTLVCRGKLDLPACLATVVGPLRQRLTVTDLDVGDPTGRIWVTGLADAHLATEIDLVSGGRIRHE